LKGARKLLLRFLSKKEMMHKSKITFPLFLGFKTVNLMTNEKEKHLKWLKIFGARDNSQIFWQLPFP